MIASPGRYRRLFDETNPNWSSDLIRNPIFVSMVQENLNEMLRVRGYVTLNEALEDLGFERTRWGDMLGWLRDPAPGEGDGRIYFGTWDEGIAVGKDWISGKLPSKTISFNIDDSLDPLTYRVRKYRAEGKI